MVYQFCQNPKQTAQQLFRKLGTVVITEERLANKEKFKVFINLKGDLLARYFLDHQRFVRRWLLNIFQHGGSERFTFGAIQNLNIAINKTTVLGGRTPEDLSSMKVY